jgi:hypothetical protein
LHNNPELLQAGYNGPRLFQELLGTHMVLTGKDRGKAARALKLIGERTGFNISIDGEDSTERTTAPANVQDSPEFIALQQQVNNINLEKQQNLANDITQQIVNVQQEKDASGKALYPQANNASFLKYAKPRVLELVRTKQVSYSDAIKQVHVETFGQVPQSYSNNNDSSRLPNNNRKAAVTAAQSVRGRATPSAKSSNGATQIPEEYLSDPYKTAEWYINNR